MNRDFCDTVRLMPTNTINGVVGTSSVQRRFMPPNVFPLFLA